MIAYAVSEEQSRALDRLLSRLAAQVEAEAIIDHREPTRT